ncbi:MAG TPA: alpha/beta hydrolase family protein [Chthoniobacteraceae bacterium]|jgi:S-formylglutathione hydrolase FrmB
MAFLDCHCFSDALELSVSFHVLLPQKTRSQIGMTGGDTRATYPVLYLLHGLSDDHTTWMRRTSIERYAAAKNLAVIMPAVNRSFYQDMAGGPRYWTFLSEELPALCRHWFPISTAREETFAAGLSMGGYGALRLGLMQPERFGAVASLSGALDVGKRCADARREGSRRTGSELQSVFGQELAAEGTSADLFHLAEQLGKSAAPLPAIFMSCGTEDSLLGDQQRFAVHLQQVGIAHRAEERPGEHDWEFWDAEIQRVLDWLPLGVGKS